MTLRSTSTATPLSATSAAPMPVRDRVAKVLVLRNSGRVHGLLTWWNHRPALLPVAVLVLALRLLNERRGDVEPLVNVARNGLDLGAKLLLDAVEVEAVLVRDEVDGETEVTKATGSTDTVEISRFGSTPCKAQWRCNACLEPFDRFKCH